MSKKYGLWFKSSEYSIFDAGWCTDKDGFILTFDSISEGEEWKKSAFSPYQVAVGVIDLDNYEVRELTPR